MARTCTGVDPRSRGEDGQDVPRRRVDRGRSPLTRGRRTRPSSTTRAVGSIPAHAGKTTTPRRTCTGERVDPRSRGEDRLAAAHVAGGKGRSPLTRGRLRDPGRGGALRGSIPAHAGKTPTTRRSAVRSRVDPRSRGEDRMEAARSAHHHGRSPLTRGRLMRARWEGLGRGSIPAHAGKTPWTSAGYSCTGVDPRSRGEDADTGRVCAPVEGRSPLTRGRLQITDADLARAGSIPAHAGKTLDNRVQDHRVRVDPRSRGEDLAPLLVAAQPQGRSPLTRGRPSRPRSAWNSARSIPAHAGKTRWPRAPQRPGRVDPRSRGEDRGVLHLVAPASGRSPLTRGRPRGVQRDAAYGGSIPAHAGKTALGVCRSDPGQVDPRSRGEDPALAPTVTGVPGRSPLTRGRLSSLTS